MKHSNSQNNESFLKEDDIRLAKEWAENLGIPWQTGDGWRAVACRLAHEVERLRMEISNDTKRMDWLDSFDSDSWWNDMNNPGSRGDLRKKIDSEIEMQSLNKYTY